MNNEKRLDYRFDEETGQMEYQRATAPKPHPESMNTPPESVNNPLSDVAMALLLGFLAGTIAVGLSTLAFIFL